MSVFERVKTQHSSAEVCGQRPPTCASSVSDAGVTIPVAGGRLAQSPLRPPTDMHNKTNHEQNKKQEKQEFRDSCGGESDGAEAQQAGDYRHDQENQCPVKHVYLHSDGIGRQALPFDPQRRGHGSSLGPILSM